MKTKPLVRRRTPFLIASMLTIAVLVACVQSKAAKELRPTVILISLDGFRADYLDKYSPPNLGALVRDGVRAQWMTPSFPSKTFPNHYAIVTGLYPQNNGIVENNVYDKGFNALFTMSKRDEVQNGRWWLGEPIWVTCEKHGQKTAPYFWPGSEAEIAGTRPTYWKPYDGTVSNEARVDTTLSLLDLPTADRPTFLTLYFSDVDNAGHEFSPDAPETRDAVLKVDNDLGRLIGGLKAREIFSRVNLIIVSDHGMAIQDPNNTIVLDELFDTGAAEKVIWTNEIVSIFPRDGKEDEIFNVLKAKLPTQAKVYRKADVPPRYHYSNSPRIAPLLVLPDEGWTLTTRTKLEEKKAKGEMSVLKGGHGYDNELPSMRAIFIGYGAAFKKGLVIEPFANVQVYNLMARILGLPPASNDGDETLALEALRDEPSAKP